MNKSLGLLALSSAILADSYYNTYLDLQDSLTQPVQPTIYRGAGISKKQKRKNKLVKKARKQNRKSK